MMGSFNGASTESHNHSDHEAFSRLQHRHPGLAKQSTLHDSHPRVELFEEFFQATGGDNHAGNAPTGEAHRYSP